MHIRLGMLVAILALVVPLGCSKSGNGGANPAETLNAVASVSDDDIRHFLARTHFGVASGDMTAMQSAGLGATVDAMLDFQPTPQLEADAMAQIADPAFPSRSELVRYWLYLMANTDQPFQELLAMFWHDHFATSQEVLGSQNRYWFLDHIQMLRTHGAGNLRDFLFAIATDWTMLRWLDGTSSVKGDPNENFAREFFELFTLGADNGYEQKDIVEAARCFTGYRIRTNIATGQYYVEWDEARHDIGYKTIFGQTVVGRSGPDAYQEYLDVIDLTLQSRGVAEFICRRLFEYFCYPDAEPEIVADLATLLRASNWELKPVLKRILMSQAFFGSRSRDGQVKSPVEYAIGFIRSTGLLVPYDQLDYALEDAGQRPTMPPNVNGWPEGTLWLSSQGVLERTNIIREAVYRDTFQTGLGFDIATRLPATQTPEAIVDHFATLLRVDLSAAERDSLITYMNRDREWATGNHIIDPFDAGTDIEPRVRGVLWIMAQHPSFHVR